MDAVSEEYLTANWACQQWSGEGIDSQLCMALSNTCEIQQSRCMGIILMEIYTYLSDIAGAENCLMQSLSHLQEFLEPTATASSHSN